MDAELTAHLQADFRRVHSIFPAVLAYVGAKPCHLYMIDPVALSPTMDGSDHDLDLTANTSANTVAVILELRQTAGGSPGRWVYIKTKAKGEAAWDHDGGLELIDSGSGICYINVWSEQWIQRTDSGQEITYNINREGTTALYLVGYLEQES